MSHISHMYVTHSTHMSHISHTYVTHMSHIAHTCHTYATHMSHIAHTCHTYATHSSHMSHICHTHVTHSTHMSLTYVAKVEKEALLTFFALFRKSRKPEFPEFPFSSQRLYDLPLRDLYRPLFMANHFTNDRPNGGPRIARFLSRSPENEKNTKNRVPKMGIFPKPEMSQKWKSALFRKSRKSQESQLFPLFPIWDTCGSPDLPDFPKSMANPRSEDGKSEEIDDILRNMTIHDTIMTLFS